TNRDLEAMTVDSTFREDLLYRLNTVALRVPPLRERRDDLEPLVASLIERAEGNGDRRVRGIDPEALELFQAYGWPGNVRELKNAIDRALLLCEADTIGVDDLPERVRRAAPEAEQRPPKSAIVDLAELAGDFRSRMDLLEARVLQQALEEAGWNHA